MDTHLFKEKWLSSQNWKIQVSGIWIPGLFIIAMVLSSTIGSQLSQALTIEDQPNIPPWYFIRQDFIQGMCDAVALLFCVTLGLVTLERHRVMASMTIWMSILWLGGKVWQMIVIFFRSDYVLHRRLARTQWTTFESYLYDPLIWKGRLGVCMVAVVIAGLFAWYERKQQSKIQI